MNEMMLMCDTETTNSLEEPIVYDFGSWLIDTCGNVYEEKSWIIRETFFDKQLMSSAFYAEKIPQYWNDIWTGKREVKSIWDVARYFYNVRTRYPDVKFCAHNAAFDVRALRNTIRYLTKSKRRYILPFDLPIYDTMRMAHDTICAEEEYVKFCETNGYMTNHAKPRPQEKAEIIYRYLTGNNNFIESHTGLEDVKIESEILWKCYEYNTEMRKECFNKPRT